MQHVAGHLPPEPHSLAVGDEHVNAALVPPLLGDIEAQFSYSCALTALIIGNAASVSTLVEAMLAPQSTAWVLGLTVSSLLEVLTRTGTAQRFELWVAAGLAARAGLHWPVRMVQTTALKLVYLRSLGGTGYVTPTMALCIGCLRAVAFGEPRAILWLDVSETVCWVLLAQLCVGAAWDATVWVMANKGVLGFEMSVRFGADHPLCNVAFRDFELEGYANVFLCGCMFIYAVFIAFLGPTFLTGMCRDFAPNATHVWVWHAAQCANATLPVGAGLTNATLSPGARL
jgi:hypothetical protein